MVQVVPRLAERQDRQPPDVAGPVAAARTGRSPTTWQTELIDQVTWCSSATRTRRGPEERRQRALPGPGDQAADAAAGSGERERPPSSGKSLLDAAGRRVLQQVGGVAAAVGLLGGRTASPCARATGPWPAPGRSSPYRHGECGSPSRSEKAWCRRWSATQWMTGPWMASEPATASAICSGRLALNEPCVKWRWKPTVTPSPVRK